MTSNITHPNSALESSDNSINSKKVLKFYLGKEFIRRFEFVHKEQKISIYHLYPTLAAWVGKESPDAVNPRSHDQECLATSVARAIEEEILDLPNEFYLANRGGTLTADALHFDSETGYVEIVISDSDLHGLADGATTDAVVAKVQTAVANGKPFRALDEKEIPNYLKSARIHIETIVGIKDRELIGRIAQARNTSRQVKSWSMANFNGAYDWVIDILERSDGPFAGRIGYEENSGKKVTILDVLSLATLFHSLYDGIDKRKAPTVAYSSKGRMDARLIDESLQAGYVALASVLEDILKLHDFVAANFETYYKGAQGPSAKLAKRQGVEAREKNEDPFTLPLTGAQVRLSIPSGLIFPLLAALRALLAYDKKGRAYWVVNPLKFLERYGTELVGCLFDQVDLVGGNPQTVGKKKAVYIALHNQARLLLQENLKEQ